MARTADQVAADDALAAAIEQCRNAYVEDATGIITEWIVLYASRRWTEDGDSLTAIGKLLCEPPPPLHHQLGMVELVATEYRKIITSDD